MWHATLAGPFLSSDAPTWCDELFLGWDYFLWIYFF